MLLCWYCVILNLSLACKGSISISFFDTSAGSLGTSLLFSGREHCNPAPVSAESRAHLPVPAQLLSVRAQNEGCSFFHQVHEAHNTTTIIEYFLKPFTFYLFCLRQQSLGFLPFKFFSWPTGEGVGQASCDSSHGFGKPESWFLSASIPVTWLCLFHYYLSILTLILAVGSTWFLHFQIYQVFSAFCYYSGEMGVGMWYSAKCQGLFLESWQQRCFICTWAIRMRHSYSETLAETDRHSSCNRETGRLTVAKPWNIWHVFYCPSFVELYLKFYKCMRILVLCFYWKKRKRKE